MNNEIKYIGLGVVGLIVGSFLLYQILPLDLHPIFTLMILGLMYFNVHLNLTGLLASYEEKVKQ